MPPGLALQRNITSGETFFGPRVDSVQDVAFVTHDGTFQTSIGSNAIETLGYYSRGSVRQLKNMLGSAKSLVFTPLPYVRARSLSGQVSRKPAA